MQIRFPLLLDGIVWKSYVRGQQFFIGVTNDNGTSTIPGLRGGQKEMYCEGNELCNEKSRRGVMLE